MYSNECSKSKFNSNPVYFSIIPFYYIVVSLNIKWTKNFIVIQISLKRTISEKGKLWMSLGPSKNGHVTYPIQEVWHLLSWNEKLLLSKPPSILIMYHTYHSPHMFNVPRSNWCLSDWYSLYVFGAVTFERLCLCFPDCQSIKNIDEQCTLLISLLRMWKNTI